MSLGLYRYDGTQSKLIYGTGKGQLIPVRPPTPPENPDAIIAAAYPKSYSTVAALVAGEGLPTNATYVLWQPEWNGLMLEQVHRIMANDDAILVLPERAAPYEVDSSRGFVAAGVSAISGANGVWIDINNTYDNQPARTWFAMTRARRGIVGMGPGVVIRPSASSFARPPQVSDDGEGLRYKDMDGNIVRELVGCQDKVIESNHISPVFANFRMEGRDFGGVAYHGITTKGGVLVRRLWMDAPHRGFAAVPNGESGGISLSGGSGYDIAGLWITGSVGGVRVASSPIMINGSSGGVLRNAWLYQANKGMPTWWNCSGTHGVTNLNTRWNEGSAINLEKCLDGFDIRFSGGTIWPNRNNLGGHPSPDGINGKLHIGCNVAAGTVKITLTDVDYDSNAQPGSLCVQQYASTIAPIVTSFNGATPRPVRIYA